MKLKHYLAGAVLASGYPIAAAGFLYVAFKGFLWAFGGRECFIETVIKEPLLEQWSSENPRQVLLRSAPLSTVPRHIVAEPEGDVAGHRHHSNF